MLDSVSQCEGTNMPTSILTTLLGGRIVPTLVLITSMFVCAQAQTTADPIPLVPGKPIEREISGGESHTYPIKLSAGQMMRVVAVQKGINIVIALAEGNGKEIWEANFSNNSGGRESLTYEAATPGEYQIILRPLSKTAQKGTYELRLEIKAAATAEDKKRINAERLLMEGLSSVRKSNFQPAIEKALEVLPLWRELGDGYWEADTLSLLGSAHNSTRKYDQAAEYYNQALAVRRQIKDRAGESNALADLSVVSGNQNKADQCVVYSSQAVAIRRELKDRAGEARVLNNLANSLSQSGRYAQAIPYLDQALEIYLALGDREGTGNTYNLKGNCHLNLGQNDDALKNYQNALEISRETKNRPLEGFLLHNLGLAKARAKQYDAALDLYEKSLAIKREINDRGNLGLTLSSIANVLRITGEYEKALKYYEDALVIARELKDPRNEVSALTGLGFLYHQLAQSDKALEYSSEAVRVAASAKNPLLEAMSYRNLAEMAYQQGLYEKEVESREKVLAIDRDVKNRQGEADDLLILAGDYRRLGRYDRAVDVLQQALVICRELKSRQSEAVALANLGIVYTVQKKYREAVPYLEQALALSREEKNPSSEGRNLINLGECFLKLGRHQESIDVSNQALVLLRESKDRDGESIALGNLGAGFSAAGQFAKAAESLSLALEIAREGKNPDRTREALNELARLEMNQGNLAKASSYLEQSLKSLEDARRDIYSPQSRATFLAAEQDSLRLYVDLLMRRSRTEPGLDAFAVEASERSRARVLLELLGEARINIRQDVDASLIAQEQSLGNQVNVWAERLERATKPELAARLKRELSQLEADLERAQSAIRRASPQYAALTQPRPLNLKEIQQQLDPDTVLLEYSLGDERSYLWAITKDSLKSYQLPKGESINQSARELYEMLTARSTSKRGESLAERQARIARAEAGLRPAAKALSQTLLAPVATELGGKRLVIVADGALQYIPFAMLPEPTTEAGPLIVNHEVVSLPSASALAIQRTELAGRQLAPKMLAVIADPVFDRSDARLTTPPTDTIEKAQPQAIALNDARSIEHLAEKSDDKSGVTPRRLVIPRLPFTRQEADQLLALTPKAESFRAMDFQANRETVLNGELKQYRYVHFATHGFLDSERPGLSALVLSMVDAEGKAKNGFLRANDIYNLKLPAELVVLSACQTGLGTEIKGEGLVGLTRGFMYAGAARVVVSLWNVNDKATADLMTKFYQKMLKQGERPAAALRAAQVEMWKQKQWQSPYYWAAFTMQGEWR